MSFDQVPGQGAGAHHQQHGSPCRREQIGRQRRYGRGANQGQCPAIDPGQRLPSITGYQ